MKVTSTDFSSGGAIPTTFAFGKYHPASHIELSTNINPGFQWEDFPPQTQSLVLLCHDSEVPSRPGDVNQEGRTVPYDLPRVDFFHWVLVDIDPKWNEIRRGEFSHSITPHGKAGPIAPKGSRQGINDYTSWFQKDPIMRGSYFGYDGPCPPWNDEKIHHYHFTLYATDWVRLPLEGTFTGPQVRKAIEGHILQSAQWTGTYAIYPKAK